MNLTAQQMLASLPVRRYADGGEATNVVPSWQADASAGRARAIAVGNEEAWLAQVKATAEKYMQNPGTAAEAYDAMVKSGIGIKDLLDSGISQDTINRALSIPTAEAQKQVNALATTAITSTLAQNPTLANEIANRGAPAIYEQARQFVANLQKDGLTDAERQYMQQVASQQGWGYSDIRAAGIDPTILFSPVPEVKKPPVTPVTPVTPAMPGTVTPVFQPPVPYTPVNVYQPLPTQPDIYAPGQPALDVAFRESAPRTAIPGMPGSYEYTPAAKLRPATGAGYSWTPPSVTSRPRSLLSPTLLSYVSPSQQFAQSRAAQDQALLGAFRSSGLPQNASNFYSWRNRLRSGEFGAGSAFDPTAFQSAFSSWASSQPPAAGTTAQGSAAPLGSVTGYSEIAGGLQPIDLRTMPFAEGGEVSAREMLARLKKSEGTEAAGLSAENQTESRNLLQKLLSLDTPQDMSLGETAVDIGAGFVPGVGTVQGARDFERARREGDMLGMGLSALSMVPIAGGAVRAARRGAKVADALPANSAERLANLERFMAGSKAPPVLYTGTSKDADFDYMKVPRNGAWFTTSPKEASMYAMENDSRGARHVPGTFRFEEVNTSSRVLPVHLSAKNPYVVSDIGAFNKQIFELGGENYRRGQGILFDKLRQQGYDSVQLLGKGGDDVWVALSSPTQVKSAIGNSGNYSEVDKVLTKKDGGEVSTEELIAQMDRIGGQPVPGVRTPQTESRSLLQNLMQGAQEIPGTVSRYGARIAGSESPMTTLGQDLSKFGGAVAQGFKESPGEFLLDVLPVVGELRSASDVDKFSRMANEAEAQGNMDLARIYRELVAVSAMGAAPLAGMGARAGKTALKGAAKAAQEAAAKAAQEAATAAPVSTAREMLDEMGLPVSAYDPEKVAKTTSMQNNPIGEAFNRQIANDVEGALNAYARLPATLNGKVIDTDSFRELSPDYQKNRGLAPSVHEPSSELAKLYFTRFLEKTRGEEGTWLFTGGGPASGKSSGVSRVMEERAQGIVDGTMSKPKQVIENIQRVIEDPTKDVQVVYIDRDPVKAFDLALARAVGMEKEFGTGRTIPIKSFLDMHKASRESIPKIYEEFKDNPRVKFQIWNNNGGPGEQFPTTVDKISTFDYNNAAERMVNRLEEAYRDGQISEEIYRGFKSGPDPRDSSGAAKSTAGRMGQIDRRINEELGKESPTQPTVNTYNINSPVLQGALDTTREVPTVVGHSLDPQLLVRGTNEEPAFKVVQSFTPNNKAATLANIDAIESTFPDPLASTESWMGAQAASFGGEYLPAPPRQALIYRQNPAQLAGMLDKLTPDLKAAVDEGFGYVNSIKNIYNSRIAPPNTTGRLFLWGILSRGVGPAQQEGAFLDVVNGAAPFIDKAVRGEFTEADLGAWKQMVARSIPEGSPGKQVTMNANAAGNLLYQLGQSADGGPSPLTQLHEILSDPRRTGQEFRRSFYQMTNKPGIDNKVVSFIGLVAGKNDLLVMDRIQSRHLWDDGTYGGANIYDGLEGGGLNKIVTGPRGLMITEMLETGLSDTVQKAYAMVGRPQDASLGRMHWETWLIAGNQPVSHSTLQAVRGGNPIGYGVTEGKRNTFSSNMTYRQAINGPIVEYPLSTGEIVRMTPTRQKEFEDFIRDKENGIIPKGFMVSESTDKPWFEQPGVDRRKLDEAARQFENANPDGSLRSGDVRDTQGGGTVSERRSQFLTDFRRDRLAVAASELQGRADRRNLAEVAGPYTRETLQADGRDGLLSFVPDNTARTLYQSAGLSVPNIRQLPSSSAASFVDGMRASMSRNSTAPQVEIKSPEELAGYRLFRTDAGSGFAIKPDGDIVSVFASPSETRGSSYAMLQAAVQAGGKKLDAFNTYLPDIYKRVGFRPVSRIPWNDDFAPPNWNKEVFREYNNGQPDIMFFVHDPNYFGESVDVPYAKDYDDAVRIQTDALNRLSPQAVEKQGTLGDALTQLNITPQRMEQWRASREGMRQERVPQVQEAAEALREGKITTEQYQQTVREYQPIRSLGAVQKMPTVEEIAMALGKNAEKSPGIVGVNVDLPNGTRVASRLDIPAYEKYDTWVVSLHDGNKTGGNAIAYGQAAVLNNVDFMSSAKAALNIATGKTAKGTIARMYGDWENRNPEMVAQQAQDILSGKAPDAADWAEVGMNPARHSYFYRKSDGMPVASAEQVIQVGPLVLAKKPVTRPVESPEHLINTPEGPRYFKKGGNVERVTNDNRKYF